MPHRAFILLSLLAFAESSSWAQTVLGDLKGKLQTADGAPIEGANVRVTGSALAIERVATSEPNGNFLVLGLPVGQHTMTITHVSYRNLVISPVRVSLGGTTNLGRLTMEAGETTLDTVVVSGGSMQYKSEFSIGFSKDIMDNLPVDRDYKNAIAMLPQVNASYFGDGLSINGSTGAENMFYLNGVNITDNYSSAFAPSLNNSSFVPYNFIKEVSVKQSGYSAEYGRAIGGIVDVVTQAGTNEFKGQAFSYYSGSFLNADPKEGATGATIGKTSNYDLGISFSGPIVKDKLWYFAAYSFYQNTLETKIAGVFYPNSTTTHLGALKIDWKASPKTMIDLTVIADPTKRTPVMVADAASGVYIPAIVENPDAMRARTENGGISLAITAKTHFSDRTQLEYGISGYEKKVIFGGATEYGDTTSQFMDVPASAISGGIGYGENFDIGKKNIRFKVTHHEDNHTMRSGFEVEYNTQKGLAVTPQGGNVYKYAPSTYEAYKYKAEQDQALLYLAMFFQHDWQLTPSILLEAGVRWEFQQMRQGDGTVQQTFNNLWQPRIGLNWFVDEGQKMKVSFNYGRVYQAIPLNFNGLFSTGATNAEFVTDYYSTDPRLPGTAPDSSLTSPIGGRPFDKNIYNPAYNDQLSLQFVHQISSSLQWSTRLLYKALGDAFIVGVDNSAGDFVVDIGNPGKGNLDFLPEVKHEYFAAELGLNGSLANNRFGYSVYYVLSRNFGNFTGIWDQEARYFSLGSNSFGSKTTPERTANQIGLLPSDRTHSLKLNMSYKLKFGMTVGLNLIAMRGTPLNEFIPAAYYQFGYDLVAPRGTSGRLPVLWDLNFRIAYQLKIVPLRLSMDIFHVGNPQSVVDQVQLKFTDQTATMLSPAFGQAVRRQPPMAVRFGIEYNF